MLKRIAIDFDDVIHRCDKGWYDGSIYGDPVDGIKEFINNLRYNGHIIIIHTSRIWRGCDTEQWTDIQSDRICEMKDWLSKHNINFDTIWLGRGKPSADIYIDDRAYRFDTDNPYDSYKDISSILQL